MIPAHPHKIPARPAEQGGLFAFLKFLFYGGSNERNRYRYR